ncbi:MAG: Lon protease [Candidatus Woesebacteria bacterium GW2011_GWB1_39_12]|uniref:Lon protease n=1 Tax=Candidatus Woesebacteria bacterium GW2011_GWB1_39_12 TaxID=1618574 RepID=A0A0G0QGV4_9BACT|nr:MAG: Lon protease [Candidatus Woesebacteria bacterium GW2011_GWB1_39_12]
MVGIFTQKDSRIPDPGFEDLYEIGTIATITQMMSTEGEIHAVVRGQARIKLIELVSTDPYLVAKVEEIPSINEQGSAIEALANKVSDLFKKAINLGKSAEIMAVMRLVSGKVEPEELADQVASLLDIKTKAKQELLGVISLKTRLEKILGFLSHEVNVLELEKSISSKTQRRFEDQMRKAMLREKKKTIEEELGEIDEGELSTDELKEYKTKIQKAGMPKDVREKAEKELKKLVQMSPHNPEGGYIRNYLDWLTDMPWDKVTPNNVSIDKAAKILEDDHYGIKKAKERILEYLAVMQIKKDGGAKRSKKAELDKDESQPTILCFIGPPGVGKTSIGKSIARALGRKFVRMSLGGIRDEAEIRGHRRTYVGALPGRIIQGIKNAGTKNPVFMLDEIDKIGIDFRGDPSSALLEALDSEQNKEFSDHYLEVAFDLSQVMFICTGNVIEKIPAALRDRMEVIRFPGYTQDEKYHIAKGFLWPKQLRMHGLENKKLSISKKAMDEVINRYTREAGVRDLERNLATILRKIARLVAEGKKYPKQISNLDVRKYLGPQKFSSLIAEKKDEVGMSTGLAVTAAGGEILFIEVALMPGAGKLTLTGQLGDVMKESAKAAFTWAKSHWRELGLKENFGAKLDVHIHVPEGAVPKDGPSAGTAMTVALVSALTGTPVKRNVGMTGEVTLRGRVLEIGGVKEKVIAGHRAGLKCIVLPKENKKDMEDIPENVQKDIKFIYATELSEVLKEALTKWPLVQVKKREETLPYRPAFLTVNN